MPEKTALTIHEKLADIQTNLIAPKGQLNKFGNYMYRSCEDILNALKPHLKEHELTLVIEDEIVCIVGRFYVKATASLHDGEKQISTTAFAREPETKKGMDESQITGATSSYARKYALNGLFCIDDTKDADATNKHEKTPPRASQSQETPSDDQTGNPSDAAECECGAVITEKVLKYSQEKFGRPLCFKCQKNGA